MNNYTSITINGKEIGLLFGMFALEEWNRLQLERNALEGEIKVAGGLYLADIICAGANNYAVVKRIKTPNYSDIIEGVCDMYGDDEHLQTMNDIVEVFTKSKFGEKLNTQTDLIKKKLDELNGTPTNGITSENSPTEV